jgi:hypothetical protein
MNERIKQLAKEAEMYVDLNGNPWPKWMSAEECELAYAKFAELIVKECVQACINEGKTFEVESAGEYSSNLYATAIKKHFGVEE